MRRLSVVVGCVFVLGGCGGGETKTVTVQPDRPSTTSSVNADIQRCVDAWNTEANNFRIMAKNFAYDGAVPYVSVGYSESFPDRCLVTLASVERNTAAQFVEAPGSTLGWSDAGGGTTNDLPDSVKGWNAFVNPSDGYLRLAGTD